MSVYVCLILFLTRHTLCLILLATKSSVLHFNIPQAKHAFEGHSRSHWAGVVGFGGTALAFQTVQNVKHTFYGCESASMFF